VPPNITGPWVPANDYMLNCTGQKCGTNTIAMRTSFQLLPDSTWVKRVLIGTGNCTEDSSFIDSIILVVESYGTIIVDLEDTDNDSLPIIFAPQPGNLPSPLPQTVPSPEPQTLLSPQPQPVLAPQTVPVPQPNNNPAPETNPAPAVNPVPQPETNPAPGTNPVPAVNPAPETNPAPAVNPISPDVSPAELNPSPFIIIAVPTPNNLIPVPTGVFPKEPSPAPVTSPLPVPSPVVLDYTGNYTVWLHVISVPMKFQVTIIDDDENIPYTENANGPCKPALQYWEDTTLGCPCNGNWFGDGTYNHSVSMGGREIIPDQCPNSSCPEAFFINDTLLYGNVRMNVTVYENGTIMNKTLEITRLSAFKEIGYAFGAADVVYVYKLANSIVDETNPAAQTPSPEEKSPQVNQPETQDNNSGTSPLALATTVTMIFVFLLMMYENTQ